MSTSLSMRKRGFNARFSKTIEKISKCKQGQRSYNRTGLLHHFPSPPPFCTLFSKTINLPMSTRQACGKHCFTARSSRLLEKYPRGCATISHFHSHLCFHLPPCQLIRKHFHMDASQCEFHVTVFAFHHLRIWRIWLKVRFCF